MNNVWRLCVMMFLQYAIWGAWMPVLGSYVGENGLGFNGDQMGWLFALLPLATILSPALVGQIADRYLPTQWILAVLHLVGGITLLWMSTAQDYGGLLLGMGIFSLFYAPTLALTNSICFHHLSDPDKSFGRVRMWGTLGWIVIGITLTQTRKWGLFADIQGDLFILGGAASILLGLFSIALPHTPPKKSTENPLAFAESFRLFRNRNFLIFMLISFVVITELQFYYILTSPFLESLGVHNDNIAGIMTLAQIAEAVVMALLLPIALPKLGIRKCLVIGILAWPIRYIIFAIGEPTWLVIASLALHGFCYVFFFTVGVLYVDSVAGKDNRASAQSLFALVTLGLGLFVGSKFTGWIRDYFTENVNGQDVVNYQSIFLVPCALTILCAIVFPLLFRDKKMEASNESVG